MNRVREQVASVEQRKSSRKRKLSVRLPSSEFFDLEKGNSQEGVDEEDEPMSPYQVQSRHRYPSSRNSKSHECEICHKTFTAKASLKWHVNAHTREVALPCTQCKRTFLRPDYVKAHIKTHQTAELRPKVPDLPHKCTEVGCERSFSNRSQHEQHLKKHIFKCAFCNRTATSRRLINYHIMEHTDEFPEQCKTCKKWFMARTTFSAHKCRLKDGKTVNT